MTAPTGIKDSKPRQTRNRKNCLSSNVSSYYGVTAYETRVEKGRTKEDREEAVQVQTA